MSARGRHQRVIGNMHCHYRRELSCNNFFLKFLYNNSKLTDQPTVSSNAFLTQNVYKTINILLQ